MRFQIGFQLAPPCLERAHEVGDGDQLRQHRPHGVGLLGQGVAAQVEIESKNSKIFITLQLQALKP